MRYQGKITSWNEARGFGFIEWNGGNDKVFVHISAFSDRQRRPAVGDIVTYEVTKDEKGQHKAQKVAFPVAASRKAVLKPTNTFGWRRYAAAVLVAAIGAGAFLRYKPHEAFTGQAFSAQPEATIESAYQCQGKTHCSQMSSCDEATFYLRNCPGTQMDGDGDGVPCESQWCN